VITVLLISQPVGLVLALVAVLFLGETGLSAAEAGVAAAAGLAGVVALGTFYRAQALGTVSVVATIGALGVVVPVAAGLLQGEEPGAIQLIGVGAGIGGVLLVAREPDPEWRAAGRTAVGLAAIAALGFGLVMLGIDYAAESDPAWTIVFVRIGGIASLVVAALIARPSLRVPAQNLPVLALIGLLEIIANTSFALATREGLLSLVSVAASLYSAVTILLARFVLGEQLARSQQVGVVIAIAGVTMIAAGA